MSSKPKKSDVKFGTMPAAKGVQTVAELDVITEVEVVGWDYEAPEDYLTVEDFESYEEHHKGRYNIEKLRRRYLLKI